MALTTPDSQRRQLLAHAAAAILFAAMAVLWSMPLVQHLSTHIAGSGAGDNVASLWNFWWTGFALEHHLDLFRTDYLFAPNGTSLALHTHAVLPALAGATVFRTLPLITAYNVMFLITFFLNAVCTYALVRRVTGEWLPAVFGAMVFAGSPFIAGHMNGHFNLLSAWTLPLVAMALLALMTPMPTTATVDRPATPAPARETSRWPVVAGVLCGATVYLDYYYTIYAVALIAGLLAAASFRVTLTFRRVPVRTGYLGRSLLSLIVLDVAAVAVVLLTGGFDLHVGTVTVRAHDSFNALQLLWILIALWAWLHYRPQLARRTLAPPPALQAGIGRVWLPAVLLAIAVASPVLIRVIRLMTLGEYVSATTYWRSGAQGVDLATLFLGNPFSRWYGGWTRSIYQHLAIDPVERSAWLGLVPIALAIVALRDRDRRQAVRWMVIGSVAFLWALGPHLVVLGQNTGMILPQAVLRYLPIVSNARIPGRAMVVVYLALAVLSGLGLSRLRQRGLGLLGTTALFALLTIDFLPSPFPLLPLTYPPIYERMRERPESGAVCTLPLGVRDGFGESGSLDHRTLFYQTIHERPMIGGFVARLAPSTRQAYDSDPLVSSLLRLSAGAQLPPADLPDRDAARRSLRAMGIAFIVLDRARASDNLIRYVVDQLPLSRLADEDPYSLFVVTDE